jgi:hypothetical protein
MGRCASGSAGGLVFRKRGRIDRSPVVESNKYFFARSGQLSLDQFATNELRSELNLLQFVARLRLIMQRNYNNVELENL